MRMQGVPPQGTVPHNTLTRPTPLFVHNQHRPRHPARLLARPGGPVRGGACGGRSRWRYWQGSGRVERWGGPPGGGGGGGWRWRREREWAAPSRALMKKKKDISPVGAVHADLEKGRALFRSFSFACTHTHTHTHSHTHTCALSAKESLSCPHTRTRRKTHTHSPLPPFMPPTGPPPSSPGSSP